MGPMRLMGPIRTLSLHELSDAAASFFSRLRGAAAVHDKEKIPDLAKSK